MTHRKPLSLTGLADPVLHLFHLTINIFWQHSFRKDINIFWQRGHSLHIVICKVEALPNPGKHRHQKMKAKQEDIPTSSLVVCIKLLLTASSVASIRNLLGFFSTIWIWLGRIRLIYDWSLSPPYFLYCHLALTDHKVGMICMISYNLNGVLKILQVPLDTSQRVPQLCRRPLLLFP